MRPLTLLNNSPGQEYLLPVVQMALDGTITASGKLPLLKALSSTESGGCVMVIDDEQSILDLMKVFLEPYGVKVRAFTNPYGAIGWYRKHWKSVDLVFLDMKNPRMDGEYCFALLQCINASVRVALMSGCVDKGIVDELLEEGALKFFAKPFDFPTIASWAMLTGISAY